MSSSTNICKLTCLVSGLVFGCNSMIGLDELQLEQAKTDAKQESECQTNVECSEILMDERGSDSPVPAACVQPEGRCVALLTEHCETITGDYRDDRAIFIGSLFSTKGAQAATNLARQQSAALAVEQINDIGGVPAYGHERPSSLVMVSCDEATDLGRAATHLINDLRVPAIIGPNTSSDTLRVSSEFSAPAGTILMTPTGVASSIAALDDNNLTYQMVPTDVQRAGLMISQINELEEQLKSERDLESVRLGIIYRDDALGIGTRTALNDLTINGASVADPANFGNRVHIDPYDFKRDNQDDLIRKYVKFAPDIIVLAGTAEAISAVLVPLEEAWTAEHRPLYVGIDSVKVPELLDAARGNADLRERVRGTGIMPTPSSVSVFEAFTVDYKIRFPGESAGISGMGPSYDAVYAVAFGIAATNDRPISGPTIVEGFARIAGGAMEVPVGATKVLSAFRELDSGRDISAIGTFSPLEWNEQGAVVGATLEMWCIGEANGAPVFRGSGLTYGIREGQSYGEYTACKVE